MGSHQLGSTSREATLIDTYSSSPSSSLRPSPSDIRHLMFPYNVLVSRQQSEISLQRD